MAEVGIVVVTSSDLNGMLRVFVCNYCCFYVVFGNILCTVYVLNDWLFACVSVWRWKSDAVSAPLLAVPLVNVLILSVFRSLFCGVSVSSPYSHFAEYPYV